MNTIPLIAGYTDGTIQWRAETLQAANWGGFHGHHAVDLAPGSTLIAGASGSGKSTLLDAYTALMMPSTVPFNSASNATGGRARSADQRNRLTYLRGKLDSSQDTETGEVSDRVLRGDGAAVWGGVAMTFVAEDGQRFTAMRLYVAPQGAAHDRDVQMRMFTIDGKASLADFDGLQAGHFKASAVKAKFPGIEPHGDSYARFSQTLFARLGIGAGGDGETALRLLAKIQAGQQVRTVNGLFKEMVLEQPVTYAREEQAVRHFADLDQAYRDLETDGEKERLLAPISELHSAYRRASQLADRLDRFGVARDMDAPFDLWRARTEAQLLEAALDRNRAGRDENEQERFAAGRTVAGTRQRLIEAEKQRRENGGEAVEALNAELERSEAACAQIANDRVRFEERIRVLEVKPTTGGVYEELQVTARAFAQGEDNRAEHLSEESDRIKRHAWEKQALLRELQDEHRSLTERTGLVPREHHQARLAIAEACGLSPEDLPFAAELLDLQPDQEDWRVAAEVTLRGVGLTMLMDERRQAQIRSQIDALTLDVRINFDGVDLTDRTAQPPDDRYISGRLVFKEGSPFVWWVKRRAFEQDHLCVDSADELGGDEAKVTRRGQTSRGRRGAHGRNRNHRNILGFSNEARRKEIEQQAQAVTQELAILNMREREMIDELAKHRAKGEAYRRVLDTAWQEIDHDAAKARVDQVRAQRDALLSASDILAELEKLIVDFSQKLEAAIAAKARLAERKKGLDVEHGKLVDREDWLVDEQARLESLVALKDEDEQYLTERFTEHVDDEVEHSLFAREALRYRRAMRDETTAQRALAQSKADTLTGVFRQFHEKWLDPNRGIGVESYPQYAEIYERIIKHGLFERRERFKRAFTEWSGNDLLNLNAAFDVAIRDIEERLDPVNDILDRLPFGAGQDRLRITVRRLHPELLTAFRRELRYLGSNVTEDLTHEQVEERFIRLRTFMGRLREPGVAGQVSYRDEVLDVRRHIEIAARRIDLEGREISTYRELGGKSGGESQELVAFIVGAALRFQLGDETRTRPRFAPVFLDEGFVKADGEHAHRAVNAWRQLGFQLILAVPLDKVTALERHMNLRLAVTKRPDGYSFITPLVEREQQPLKAVV